jgi:hypothetical protein
MVSEGGEQMVHTSQFLPYLDQRNRTCGHLVTTEKISHVKKNQCAKSVEKARKQLVSTL